METINTKMIDNHNNKIKITFKRDDNKLNTNSTIIDHNDLQEKFKDLERENRDQKIIIYDLMKRVEQTQSGHKASEIIKKTTKTIIPKALRDTVFTTYCKSYDNAQCFVGCGDKITPFNFECGHVVSEHNGGKTTIENLRPVCGRCNRSMGTKNMYDFMKTCGFIADQNQQVQCHSKMTDTMNNILVNVKSNSIKNPKIYPCTYCGTCFTMMKNMYRHRKHQCKIKPQNINDEKPQQVAISTKKMMQC